MKHILLIYCLMLTMGNLQAQYVPKHQRKNQVKSHNIEIKAKQTYQTNKPLLVCDTLIMHDKATLKIVGQKRFSLYARYVKIGKKCAINAVGVNGTKKKPHAQNGTHLLLNMNIYAMGSLRINTSGGNAYKSNAIHKFSKIPLRLGGSGGNVQFNYYSPLVISRRKPSRNQATVWFSTNRGTSYSPPRPKTYQPKDRVVQGVVNGKMTVVNYQPADPNRSNPARNGEYRDAQAQIMRLSKGEVALHRVAQPLKF